MYIFTSLKNETKTNDLKECHRLKCTKRTRLISA